MVVTTLRKIEFFVGFLKFNNALPKIISTRKVDIVIEKIFNLVSAASNNLKYRQRIQYYGLKSFEA